LLLRKPSGTDELVYINEQNPKHFNDPKSINSQTLSNSLSMEELIEINEQSPKHFDNPKSINCWTLSNSLSMAELIEINEQSPKHFDNLTINQLPYSFQ
jgi:hypothetical protein